MLCLFDKAFEDIMDSEEASDLEELLSQLEEESQQELGSADNHEGPLHPDLEKRYEKLRAQSFTSHVNTELDASENSKSCTFQTGDEIKGPASPPGQEACDAACATEVHLVEKESSSGIGLTHASKVAQGDAAKKASIGIPQGGLDSGNASKVALAGDAVKEASIDRPHISPVKLPPPQHEEAYESIGRPLSPPSPPPGGCSCFSLPSKRGVKKQKQKQKKKQLKGGGLGSNNNDLGKREQEKIEEEWAYVLKEPEGVGEGHAGIFDVKGTEMEFKRVSKKEKQLAQEAHKFLEKVASTSARLTSPPHYAQ